MKDTSSFSLLPVVIDPFRLFQFEIELVKMSAFSRIFWDKMALDRWYFWSTAMFPSYSGHPPTISLYSRVHASGKVREYNMCF